MKAILHYRASAAFQARLQSLAPAWLQIEAIDERDHTRFAASCADATVLLHVLEPVTAAMIEAAPALRLIQKIGVGVNTIDIGAARARGIAVANMPGTNSQAVAEIALGMMLTLLRRLVFLDAQTRLGRGWQLPPDTLDHVGEICGRVVGFVGFGEVPRHMAPAIKALGGRVIYADPTPKTVAGCRRVTLDELFAQSDIISLHVPLTEATQRMIDDRNIGRMKRGAILINTARGGLIDEPSLLAALRSGQIAAAGLDVLSEEPAPADHPLLSMPNVLVTPHIAWLTPETLERSVAIAIQNCERLSNGQPLLHQVA